MRCRILDVTPNPGTHRLLEELLQPDADFSLEHVPSGTGALEELTQRPDNMLPNLIILAWWLPLLTGTEVVASLKSDKRLRAIPVIVLDSDLPDGEVGKLYTAGVSCVIENVQNLDEFARFAEGMRAFWINLAILPFCE